MPLTRLIPLLFLAFLSTLHAGRFSTVVIDAGHGGKDIGCNYSKVYEKHLALDTAKRIEFMLRKKGFRTRLTRNSDVFISLQKRTSIGNRYGNSIFVSLHFNYTYRKAARGIETFYHSSRSKKLARYVHAAVIKRTRADDRKVKYARYYVIRNAKNPAILVEGGFLSNSSERKSSKKGNYRQKLAEGVVEGISRYQAARASGKVH